MLLYVNIKIISNTCSALSHLAIMCKQAKINNFLLFETISDEINESFICNFFGNLVKPYYFTNSN